MIYSSGWSVSVAFMELVFKVCVLFAVTGCVGALVRRRVPAASHLLWVLTFGAVLALPLVANYGPDSCVLYYLRPTEPALNTTAIIQGNTQVSKQVVEDVAPNQLASNQVGTRLQELQHLPNWMIALMTLWAAGAVVVGCRTTLGLLFLRVIRRFGTNTVESDELADDLDQLSARAGVTRTWDLRISANRELALPMTWGVYRPTVVLPIGAEEWSQTQFEAVLLHELAHVRRFDFLSQLVAEAACALYWFLPFVWLGARAMRSDAELAADEAVLQTGMRPSEYAAQLLKLAMTIGPKKQPYAYAGTPAMNNSKIETRLESVLHTRSGHRGMTTFQILASCCLAAVVIPAIAGIHARANGQVEGSSTSGNWDDSKSRLKQAALATLMYCADYDDHYPYAISSAQAAAVMYPYAKNIKIFQSPTKGGVFTFNLNLAGVNVTKVTNPAETPLWTEIFAKSKDPRFVAYADGHVKLTDFETYAKSSTWKFPREKAMKPFPATYMPPTPSGAPSLTTPASQGGIGLPVSHSKSR